jgi:endo-1,4-beta-xylanase
MSTPRRIVARSTCALALLCAFAPPVLAQTTIVSHTFEDGTTQGWAPRGPVALSASNEAANGGFYSLKTTGRTAAWNGPSLNIFPLVSSGKTYQVTGYVRLTPGTDASELVFTVQREAGGSSFDRVASAAATDGAWVRIEGLYSFPAGATALSLYLESSNASASYYLDDFSIIELSGSGCPVPLDQTGFVSDFEDATAQGWARRGPETVAATTADAHSGAYSLLTSARTSSWNGPSHNAQCKMHNGSRYRVSLWAKLAPGEPDVQLRVSIQRSLGGTTNYNTVLGNKTVTANEWVHFEGNYTFAFDTTSLSIYVESSAAVGDPPHHPAFYIDDFELTYHPQPPIEPLTPVKEVLEPYFLIGTAIEPSQTSTLHSELLLRHFSSLTAENAMKLNAIHPAEGTYNFGPADTLANFARSHGLPMRGHTLLWHEQVPEWFFEHADGTPLDAGDRDLLLERLRAHIETIVGRYDDVVGAWDVVNEPIDASQPGGLRVTPWLQIIGPDYIDKAFEYARQYARPGAKLYLNEYSTTEPAKRQALFDVVAGLIARGAPIDGVGHQMHINVHQPSAAEIRTTLEMFGGLGLDNQITEMDMSVYSDSDTRYDPIPSDLLVLQGHRYKEIFRELRRLAPILSSVTLWGLGDDTSWLNKSRKDAPLLFDEDLQAKPAYWGVVDPSQLPVLIQTLEVSGGTPHIDAHTDRIWDIITPVAIVSDDGSVPATFKALWDGSHVYVRVDVVDFRWNRGDGIDVFIDENNDKSTSYGPDDVHYAFNHFGRTHRPNLRALMVPTWRGYRLEAAIPLWQPLSIGRQIGFDVRVRSRGQAFSWNDTTNHQDADTSRFGVIALVRPIETAAAAYGTPVIDALEDRIWARAEEFSADTFVVGSAGATARVKTLWDAGHLYVFARVTDPLLSSTSANAWEQDSIEIFLDQNNAKTTSYEADDGQYRVNYENAQSYGGAASAADFVTATRVVDGGYIVEAAIVLDAVRPRPGLLIGFDFQVNDDGTGTGVRSSAATWNDESGRAYLDPSRFGVLRLRLGNAARRSGR